MLKRVLMIVSVTAIFSLSAMDSADEVVLLIEQASSLAAALNTLDMAYKAKEQAFLSGVFDSTLQEAIEIHKKEYNVLLKEKRTNVVLEERQDHDWHTMTMFDLQNKDLRTVLCPLPDYINPAVITFINFSHNNLEDLPLSFLAKTVPNLKSLCADHNKISYVSAHGKRALRQLSHLTLSHNNITGINLVALLKKCSQLKTLNLSDNPLGSVALEDESTWNLTIHKELAIDLRNTKLSQQDIELLKKYCLAGVHNSFKRPACGGFLCGAFGASWCCVLFVSLCAQQFSSATIGGGVALGTSLAGMCTYGMHKHEVGEWKEFHTIRYDHEQTTDDDNVIVNDL